MTNRKSYQIRRLDFEIGYLIKSPCRECHLREGFPGCMDTCDILDRVQTHLARGISSCRAYSPLESFSLALDGRRQKTGDE